MLASIFVIKKSNVTQAFLWQAKNKEPIFSLVLTLVVDGYERQIYFVSYTSHTCLSY